MTGNFIHVPFETTTFHIVLGHILRYVLSHWQMASSTPTQPSGEDTKVEEEPSGIYTPLKFWFCGRSSEDLAAKRAELHERYAESLAALSALDSIASPKMLQKIYNDLEAMASEYDALRFSNASVRSFWPPLRGSFQDELIYIQTRIELLTRRHWYALHLTLGRPFLLNQGDPIPGTPYTSPVAITPSFLALPTFQHLYTTYWRYPITEGEMTKETFMTRYKDEACSDWSKKDAHGKCFGSASWLANDLDAYQITRKENGEALWDLPYPKAYLLWAGLVHGCGNRMESVAYAAALAHVMERAVTLTQRFLGWKVLQAWRVYRRHRAAGFLGDALWFAYYRLWGFFQRIVLPRRQAAIEETWKGCKNK